MSYRAEIKRIYKQEGFRGFFSGYSGMFLRDTPGFAFHFTLYEAMKRRVGISDKDKQLPSFANMSTLDF